MSLSNSLAQSADNFTTFVATSSKPSLDGTLLRATAVSFCPPRPVPFERYPQLMSRMIHQIRQKTLTAVFLVSI